jgi:hypothetical protein
VQAGETVGERFGWQFRMRDKVIQTENDYDNDVFNGDIGEIWGQTGRFPLSSQPHSVPPIPIRPRFLTIQ